MTITINQELFGKPDALKGARPVWGWGLGAVPGPTPRWIWKRVLWIGGMERGLERKLYPPLLKHQRFTFGKKT